MKFLTLAVLALAVYCASSAKIFDSQLDNVRLSFKTEHGKTYESETEEANRYTYFLAIYY